MQEVGHDALGQGAVGCEKLGADIEEEDLLVVSEALHDGVGGFVLLAELVFLVRAAREDGENQDLGVGALLLELGDDGLDAFGGLLSGALVDSAVELLLSATLVSGVIGANHEHDFLRLEAVEVTVFQAPKNVLGAVATDAKVGSLERSPGLFPDGLALTVPTMGDRVAEEDELRFAFLRNLVEGLVTFLGAGMQDRLDSIVGATGQSGGGNEQESNAGIHGGEANLCHSLIGWQATADRSGRPGEHAARQGN